MQNLSNAAQAAKQIRIAIKAMGFAARVTSSRYSGGSNVNVHTVDLTPAQCDQIKALIGSYEYGHFDGMTDCYEYSNSRADLPQVKFAFLENEISHAVKADVYAWLRANWHGGDALPEVLSPEAQNLSLDGDWVSTHIHQQLSRADSSYWQSKVAAPKGWGSVEGGVMPESVSAVSA